MVRVAHRTLVARLFAVCLIVFAATPITAPFTVCDLADFSASHPLDVPHHPGHDMAEVHLHLSPRLVTTAAAIDHFLIAVHVEHGEAALSPAGGVRTRLDLHAVLRL